MVPGGFSASAREVEQEGLRLPPVKLFKRGVMDAEIWAITVEHPRADQRIGDIAAQRAALWWRGATRLGALMDRYGEDTVTGAIAEMRRIAAGQMRAELSAVRPYLCGRAGGGRQRRGR